jgi:hemoglobin-like flavoprotein
MTDSNAQPLILDSFERAADSAADITMAVYERYFARCPESRALMRHVDRHMQGRMMTEVLELLMMEDPHAVRDYLAFETRSHASYGVERYMYANLLQSVRDAVQAALGAQWNVAYASAWSDRLSKLLAEIEAVAPEKGLATVE